MIQVITVVAMVAMIMTTGVGTDIGIPMIAMVIMMAGMPMVSVMAIVVVKYFEGSEAQESPPKQGVRSASCLAARRLCL